MIENQRIIDLPLNGRQVTDLITLSGSSVFFSNSAGYGMRTGVLISVAGGSYEGVQYNYDGAPHINTLDASNMPLPFPDALQEFKVTTSAQDASAVGHSGASVNVVTKSGTNSFHGDAFEFLRNYDANARDFFASKPRWLEAQSVRRHLRRAHQEGQAILLLRLPGIAGPAANRAIAGERSNGGNVTRRLHCRSSRRLARARPKCWEPVRHRGFANNHDQSPSFSPAAVKIANSPERQGRLKPQTPNACGILPWSLPNNENDNQVPVRVDYQLNDKHTLFARYLLTKQQLAIPYSVSNNPLTEATPGFDDQAQNVTIGETFTSTRIR